MKPRVINLSHKPYPAGEMIRICSSPRSTGIWVNPFKLTNFTRKQAVLNYITVNCINKDFLLAVRKDLKGKHLGCLCMPKICHGDWLLHIANCEEEEFKLMLSGRLTSQAHWDRLYPDSEPEK